jgi:hypothetical protein
MSGGIGHVNSPGQHRHRHAIGSKCSSVRGAVDTVGATGDDGHIMVGQTCREFCSDMFTVGRAGSRSDNRRGTLGDVVQSQWPDRPEHQRRPALRPVTHRSPAK